MTGDAPRFHRALGWGLVAALLTRVALAARAPIIEVDGAYWAGLAAAIERGDFRHGLSTAWPPLYPALIAVAARVARLWGSLEPATLEACARAVSVLAGTLLLVPLHALARQLLPPRAAGLAVALAAFHPRMLQYSAAALSEATYTLLLVTGLAFMVAREREARAAWRREAAAGALFGLAYLVRPEGLPLAGALWAAGLFVRPPGRAISRLRPAFAIAAIVVALPWLLFLHATLGRWSLGEKGEYNFWRSFAVEYGREFPPPAGLAERVNESPERAPAPAGDPVRAAEFTLRHPDVVLARCARNLGTILASTLPVTLYWPLVPLAVLGLARGRGRNRDRAQAAPPAPAAEGGSPRANSAWPPGAWPVAVALTAMPLLYAPFSVDRRFFVPAVPLLLIACAAGVVRIESWLARGTPGAAPSTGPAAPPRFANAALALLIVLSVAYTFARGTGFDHAPEHRRAGEWLRRNHRNTSAMGARSETALERPVVMSRKPWVAFYSGGLIATLPDAPAELVLARARAKGADVLVADARSAASDRPGLASLVDPPRDPDGFAAIHREPGPPALVLYRPLR